ncbi:sensor histidine kinase [Desulfuromonas acetoxidans]|uniref:histidine kinase n=1 Tax=Desulfuromonas acetoxidans (strain DSM 684 / 11070) TaxID=281689 RepID=Q1K358_DESA6|nr:sensor histidine kinase [Desulfuromonas acetoxidans]EAT17116.1 periplasmic sensor signal transduction histidine kinase [Desulfuromonas acetoxidans DSM 684]NVD24123.1 sensor histidine kinase [Desulfuromonas acetoxidans]NVE16419.1 sensor histidine kinase [Desulfuromonas acetoxidans]
MKFFLQVLLALLLLSNTAVAADLPAVDITPTLNQQALDHSTLHVLIDPDKTATVTDLLVNKHREWHPAERNSFPYTTAAVWSQARLHNSSSQPVKLHLINDFVAHDEVNIYLIRGGTVSEQYQFGDTRPIRVTEILNRFANVHITLHGNETIEVLTRYASTTPISIKMKLLSEHNYSRLAIEDLTIWGVFIGVTLALVIYNVMMFVSLRNVAFLFYVLHSLANGYNTLTSSGHVYAFLSPLLPLAWLNLSYKITPSVAVILMSLFIITFFDLKHKIGWLYKLNLANIGLFSALLASLLYFYPSGQLLLHNKISSLLLPLALLFMLFSALVVAWHKLFAGRYFLIGAGIFFFTMLNYVLCFTGLVDFGSGVLYVLPTGMAAEAIFFAMALGQKIKRIEAERAENALLLDESNKFNSTSYLLAGILHQFKQPLIYLGTEVLKLRTQRYQSGQDDVHSEEILGHMESQISGMNDLVGNFYSFYSQQPQLGEFDLQHAIDTVLDMLASSLQAGKIKVIKDYQGQQLCADEKALKQILLILLENTVSVLQEKSPDAPTLWLTSSGEKQVTIEVRDNAGGIDPQALDKIFNIHYSRKQAQGLGIGLALARKLAETRLNGSLTVHNEPSGACFVLVFGSTY